MKKRFNRRLYVIGVVLSCCQIPVPLNMSPSWVGSSGVASAVSSPSGLSPPAAASLASKSSSTFFLLDFFFFLSAAKSPSPASSSSPSFFFDDFFFFCTRVSSLSAESFLHFQTDLFCQVCEHVCHFFDIFLVGCNTACQLVSPPICVGCLTRGRWPGRMTLSRRLTPIHFLRLCDIAIAIDNRSALGECNRLARFALSGIGLKKICQSLKP